MRALFVALLLLPSLAQAAPPLYVHKVRVFDGTRAFVGDVVVRDGAIAAVAPSLKPPPGAEVVDGAGRTLLPGLIDAHTHAGDEARTLEQALAFGVTLELDLFGPVEWLKALRQKELSGAATGMADLRGAACWRRCRRGTAPSTASPSRR